MTMNRRAGLMLSINDISEFLHWLQDNISGILQWLQKYKAGYLVVVLIGARITWRVYKFSVIA